MKMETSSSKNLRNLSANDPDAKIDYGLTRDLRTDVTELKSTLKQIQKEQLSLTASLGNVDDALKDVWIRISAFDSTLPSLVLVSSLDLLKQEITTSLDKLQKLMDENQETFRSTFGLSIDAKLDQIYAWFHKVEDSLKTKQQRLYSQIESLAQECDLAALRENVREDFIHFQKRLDHLDKGLDVQYGSIKSVQIQNALKVLFSMILRKKDLTIKQSWKKWENFIQHCHRMKDNDVIKAKTMRKLLLRTCFGRKERAWERWYHTIQNQKCVEKRRSEASALVLRTLQHYCSISLKDAFRRWHRLSVWDKRVALFDVPVDSSSAERSHSEQLRQATLKSLEYSIRLRLALSSLKNDHEGAIIVLTNELCNIRSLDLIQILKEVRSGDDSLQNRLENGIESIQNYCQKTYVELEEKCLEETLKNGQEISGLKNHVQAMENRLLQMIQEAEKVGEFNSQQIQSTAEIVDALVAKEKVVDDQLERIDATLEMLDVQSRKLQMANHNLEEKLRKHEEITNRMKADFQVQLSQLQSKVEALLTTTGDHSRMLQGTIDSVDSLKIDHMQVKINMDERFDGMIKSMNVYGVRKPNMTIIIEECLAYETLSKERNYSVTLNRISVGEDEVDLAGDIASFAHDYATWIAFQVDHEVLQSIIVGRNPDDLVYANDESAEKRNFLLVKLRSRLEAALEEAYPRAGAQRMEARTKFINRVIEATETALSKYDQVLVPISARLAKVRASVPTCMACDRPLRVKERNTHLPAVGSNVKAGPNIGGSGSTRSTGIVVNGKSDRDSNMAESMESKAQTLNCILSSAATTSTLPLSDTVADSTNYVLRGGFKMPLAHRT